MKIRAISIIIFAALFNCNNTVSCQTPTVERQPDIIRSPTDAGNSEAPKGTDLVSGSGTADIKNNYFQGLYKDRKPLARRWPEDIVTRTNFSGKMNFEGRAENSLIQEFTVSVPIHQNILPPDKFIFQPLVDLQKDVIKDFNYRKASSPNAVSNIFYKRFYENSTALDDETGEKFAQKDQPDAENTGKEKFHWKSAIIQSGIFLGIQQAFRMTEAKTKRYLGGEFFGDWKKSVGNLRGWGDGNRFFTNYVAHPMQGGLTGRIFINNSDRAKKQEFGKSKTYWESRLKAMAWSAVWSTQFELGPISEASVGNVGMLDETGRSRLSWGDLVVTPVLGTGWAIAEDAIDKYILKNWLERKARYKLTTKIKILRTFLTPTTSVANILRGKAPWKRDNRTIYVQQMGSN